MERCTGITTKKEETGFLSLIPTWLEGHVKEREQKRLPTVTLCSSAGNELLEVWYYGDLLTVKGESQSYIIDRDEAPGLVAARDPESGEEFVIFDGGQHGYDNMFCDEHNPASWRIAPSSGMRSLPLSWCWNWATISTMRMKKRTSR